MSFLEFKIKMLESALTAGQALGQTSIDDIKIEPEQLRKNIGSILSILIETQELLKEIQKNVCSNS